MQCCAMFTVILFIFHAAFASPGASTFPWNRPAAQAAQCGTLTPPDLLGLQLGDATPAALLPTDSLIPWRRRGNKKGNAASATSSTDCPGNDAASTATTTHRPGNFGKQDMLASALARFGLQADPITLSVLAGLASLLAVMLRQLASSFAASAKKALKKVRLGARQSTLA